RLILAVHRLREAAKQNMLLVAFEERIPLRTPQDLDDVPARAAEQPFELLDDLPVAAHGTVEPLKIAVHDEGEIVEPLARSEREAGGRFRFVHLAVSEHAPYAPPFRVGQTAVAEIAHETRLIDRAERSDPHRAGWRLPEIGHQPGMRIGAEARAADFPPIMPQALFRQAALEEGAGVNARRGVRLEENDVAAATVFAGAEEMLAMWPPSSPEALLARMTIASAFQRMIAVIRSSISISPGNGTCFSSRIVLRQGEN